MRALRWLGIGLLVLVVAVGGLALGARFADGPIAVLPGGSLRSGPWVEDPNVDWSFAQEIAEIELESGGRSRTTWILVLDGEAYVPCSLSFPPGKRWHLEARESGDAVVRVEGSRYKRELRKVEDPALHQRLYEVVREKYAGGPGGGADDVWFFRLAPPPA